MNYKVPCDRCGSEDYTDDGSHTVYCLKCGSGFHGETLADAYRLWETSKRTCTMERLEGSYMWECSSCGQSHEEDYTTLYCPWCGAKVTKWQTWAVKSGEEGLADRAIDRAKERRCAV